MNKATLSHLLPSARKQAALGDDERIKGLLRDRWIDYPRATQALQQLERLYETPRRERMPCLRDDAVRRQDRVELTARLSNLDTPGASEQQRENDDPEPDPD